MEVANESGEIPELYIGGLNVANENTPLAWGQSLAVVAGV